MRVMIAVTHLLGAGHLARAIKLAAAFAETGHEARLVSGGVPVESLQRSAPKIIQLPPLRAIGTDFTNLRDANGALASTQYRERRIAILLEAFKDFAPDLLITELFPFGRRNLKAEFLALLQAARAQGTCIVASVRDILAPPSKPAKAAFADEVLASYYKGVLVHSDADVVPLSESWPISDALAPLLRYTGFVAPAGAADPMEPTGIVVSAGGGSVGDPVFRSALDAARLLPEERWHFFVGGAAERARDLAQHAPANVRVEGLSPDFRGYLASARASVSLAGYNTSIDLLQCGTPAVLVPFDEGGEIEQSIRADALARLPGIRVLKSAHLSGAALAGALQDVISAGARPASSLNMNGALHSVRICEGLCSDAV